MAGKPSPGQERRERLFGFWPAQGGDAQLTTRHPAQRRLVSLRGHDTISPPPLSI
jgi:hypothetical protein